MVLAKLMLSPMRTLVILAFALQAMLGPVHLTLGVCHGRMQLLAGDGSWCCSPSDESDEHSAAALDGECSECSAVELPQSAESIALAKAVETDSSRVAVATTIDVVYVWPAADRCSFAVKRAPPRGATPTGLMPGAFPLRI